jgi:hypothetical protein
MQMWKDRWYARRRPLSTADAGKEALTNHEGGQVECATQTAVATARAISELVSVLHERGLLRDEDVVRVLGLHGYEPVEM